MTNIDSSGAVIMPPTMGGDTLHDFGSSAARPHDAAGGENHRTVIALGRTAQHRAS